MIAAAVTDILDGWLARRMSSHSTDTGAWLDPLCDKVFIVSALGVVWSETEPRIRIPAIIATREILQVPLAMAYWGYRAYLKQQRRPDLTVDLKAAPIGKLTTVAQFAAISAIFTRHRWSRPLAQIAGAAGALAAAQYLSRGMKVLAENRVGPAA